jgi:ribosomal protein S12 methylthiotransferase accessory factor
MKTANPIFPRLVWPAIIDHSRTTFLTMEGRFQVALPARQARRIISRCDGGWSLAAIAEESKQGAVANLLHQLLDAGVLVDAANSTEHAWRLMGRSAWSRELRGQGGSDQSALAQTLRPAVRDRGFFLQAQRSHWTRLLERAGAPASLGAGRISGRALATLLWSTYGLLAPRSGEIPRRTVYSTARLFPLVLHLVALRDAPAEPGVYRVEAVSARRVALVRVGDVDRRRLEREVMEGEPIQGAAGILVLSASFTKSAPILGTRALLYTIVEAGRAAQNFSLAAAEEGLAVRPVNRFSEEALASILHVPPPIVPVLPILFGTPGPPREPDVIGKPIVTAQRMGRSTVFDASVRTDIGSEWVHGPTGYGRAKSRTLAILKARAEAFERLACFRPNEGTLVRSRYVDLPPKDVVDPRTMYTFLQDQSLAPFDPREHRWWCEMRNEMTGSSRLVLADLVYVRVPPPVSSSYVFASSSGTAAHTTRKAALDNAYLELVEREAFMVTWLNRLVRDIVVAGSLPSGVQRRMRRLERAGYTVRVLDITLDQATTVLVTAVAAKRSALMVSAASGFEVVAAIEHALGFVEQHVAAHAAVDRDIVLAPSEVRRPSDHGRLYLSPRHVPSALFLLGNPAQTVTLRAIERRMRARTLAEGLGVLSRAGLEPLVIELGQADSLIQESGLQIVKVVVPGMVPISFGAGREPLGLPRVRSLPVTCGLRSRPLSAPRLNRFPHPFD